MAQLQLPSFYHLLIFGSENAYASTVRPFQIDLLFLVNWLVGFLGILKKKKNNNTD